MTDSNFVYVDGVVIERRTKTNFKVTLEEEEWEIYVPVEQVNKVVNGTKQDENLVAVLMAYVSYIRQATRTRKNELQRLSDEKKVDGLIRLLNGYEFSIETLIDAVRGLKWHQLREVLLAESPAGHIDEIT